MANVNIMTEVAKAEAGVLAAVATSASLPEIMRLQGRVDALRDLCALIDSGKGNDAPAPVPPPVPELTPHGAKDPASEATALRLVNCEAPEAVGAGAE